MIIQVLHFFNISGYMSGLYAAFDVFPSTKGSATHISHFASTLFEYTNGGILCALAGNYLPKEQSEDNISIKRLSLKNVNYLERAEAFSRFVSKQIELNEDELSICHFRDIWGGMPILKPERNYKTVFEVNGLTSVELPYRYPYLTKSFIQKLRKRELFCLQQADTIVTPSQTTADFLQSLGTSSHKIEVIRNGALIPEKQAKPDNLPEKYIIYFGALQTWQGVDVLLKAFAGLKDFDDLHLVICNAGSKRVAKPYKKLASKLEVDEKVIWFDQLEQKTLWAMVQHALVSVAPLKEGNRNIEQGCCPLKILESMACGTAVIASELPVCTELIEDNTHGKLVPPERPAMFSRAIRFLVEYPDLAEKMGKQGQQQIEEFFTWQQKKEALKSLYSRLNSLI